RDCAKRAQLRRSKAGWSVLQVDRPMGQCSGQRSVASLYRRDVDLITLDECGPVDSMSGAITQ
ncbi:hypothetical protein HAX54_052400, partial [Datura stramonium]|nr:hypothetical protein [Datura stramonium]